MTIDDHELRLRKLEAAAVQAAADDAARDRAAAVQVLAETKAFDEIKASLYRIETVHGETRDIARESAAAVKRHDARLDAIYLKVKGHDWMDPWVSGWKWVVLLGGGSALVGALGWTANSVFGHGP